MSTGDAQFFVLMTRPFSRHTQPHASKLEFRPDCSKFLIGAWLRL